MNNHTHLLRKIQQKKAKIAIIGLGYVGLPLAILFVRKEFSVFGYSRTEEKVKLLTAGTSGLIGFDNELKRVIRLKKFSVDIITSKKLQDNDIFIVCVPTPITKEKKPDLSSLKNVAKQLSKINLENKLIINESTVAPFTTKNIFGTLKGNYFLACSPERIDPGSNKSVENITKVIGGRDSKSLELGLALYLHVLKKDLIAVKSMEIAEMSKMLENAYRAVNIGLVNEFARLADAINIDILDVISVAKTKWNFYPHYPGIGVGGHCIPVDPYYVLTLASKKGIDMKIVKTGLKENEYMPKYVAEKVLKNYKKGMHVLVYGLTYKKNVSDLRESPVIDFCRILKQKNVNFTVFDPLLSKKDIQRLGFNLGKLEAVDIFIVGTDHKNLTSDSKLAIKNNTIIIDGRNFFNDRVGKKVLGVGRLVK